MRILRCWGWGEHPDGALCSHSPLTDREKVSVGSLTFEALATPGHTVGHMVYVLDGGPFGGPPCLFSGDLLFLAGCGECPQLQTGSHPILGWAMG